MGAPEKLYINSKQRPDKEIFYGTCTKVEGDDIEYTRTDAFIEKACEWLSKHAKKYYFNKDGHYLGTDELIEDFKLSMEL